MSLPLSGISSTPKPGDKSQALIKKALDVAIQNLDILPRVFSMEEMKRDIELAEAMKPVLLAIMQCGNGWKARTSPSTAKVRQRH